MIYKHFILFNANYLPVCFISKNAQNISWPLHTNMISSKQNLAEQEMISEFMVYARRLERTTPLKLYTTKVKLVISFLFYKFVVD